MRDPLNQEVKALLDRIRAMAQRWHYTPEDLRFAEADARLQPQQWVAACEWDESVTRKTSQAGLRWPPLPRAPGSCVVGAP
jgi:hypothetical protein